MNISTEKIANELLTIFPTAIKDGTNAIYLPSLRLAIVISQWGVNDFRFSLFYSYENDYKSLVDNAYIFNKDYPTDYVAHYCLTTICEKWLGSYLPDEMEYDDAALMKFFREKVLTDKEAYYAFK